MQLFIEHLKSSLIEISVYFIFYAVSSTAMLYLSKLKSKRNYLYSTLIIVKTVLAAKFGSKANDLIDIWMEGLKKIEDGEFSNEDKTDQFLRYLRLAAKDKNLSLSDKEIEILHTVVLSTFEQITPEKPKEVKMAVNKFNAMNKV